MLRRRWAVARKRRYNLVVTALHGACARALNPALKRGRVVCISLACPRALHAARKSRCGGRRKLSRAYRLPGCGNDPSAYESRILQEQRRVLADLPLHALDVTLNQLQAVQV